MEQILWHNIVDWQWYLYNTVLLLTFLYLVTFKYAYKQEYCYIVCLFWGGMVDDYSSLLFDGRALYNVYQIIMLIWGVMLLQKTNYKQQIKIHPWAFLSFIIYSFYFLFIPLTIHRDSLMLVLAQYAKLFIPICFMVVINEMIERGKKYDLFWVFWDVLLLQIMFSILKMTILGGYLEGWVGSLTGIRGGGMGTSLPLLGLFMFALKTDFKIRGIYDVCFLVGLLFIGFATGKRAVWVLFPILYVLLGMYVYRHGIVQRFVVLTVIVPLLVYAALRLSPSLNPEKVVGGNFDPEYALNYGLKYSAGIDSRHNEIQTGVGRVGAVSWMWQRILKPTKETLLGSGLEYLVYASNDNYSNKSYYQGINGRGSITGVVNMFMTIGLIGVILFLILIISIFRQNKSRFAILVLLTALFDFFFYNATILTSSSFLTLSLFLNFFLDIEPQESLAEGEITH